jgi:hypothetical protein
LSFAEESATLSIKLLSPMPESIPTPPHADLSQRKRIVIAVAAVFCVIMAFAFFSGGKKTPPKKDTEPDLAVGIVQDGTDFQFGAGAPEDWLNAPEGMTVAENSGTKPTPESLGRVSSVVSGDDPTASPAPSPVPTAATTPASGSQPSTTTDARPSNGAAPAVPANNTPVASASQIAAAPTPPTVAKSSPEAMPVKPANSVPPTSVAEQPASPSDSPTSSAPKPSASTIADVPAKKSEPSPLASSAIAKSQSSKPANDNPQNPSASGKVARPSHAPEFVRPVTKKTGVIAQTRALISEDQFHQTSKNTTASDAPAASPAPSKASEPNASPPARVRQEEALKYAQQTTERLRSEKILTPGQQARLPRSSEAPSTRIWREDDTPATADERRPFGLVIEETNPAFTPEGIPLRTDIPEGKSSLEKTGADKPLWKRPE